MPRRRVFYPEELFGMAKSCILCGKKMHFWQRKDVWTDYWYDQGNGNSHSYLCHKKCIHTQRQKESRESWDEASDATLMLNRIDLFINTYKNNEADEYLLALLPNAIKQSKNAVAELSKKIDKLEKYQEEAKKNILMRKLSGLDSSEED